MTTEAGPSARSRMPYLRRVGIAMVIGLLLPGLLPGAAAASVPAGTGSDRLTATTYPSRFLPGTTQSATVKVADWQPASAPFNPYLSTAYTNENVTSVSEGSLVRMTDDLKYEPDEATAVPTVANGGVVPHHDGSVTVDWTLRPGLEWSDGMPLTCKDFAYTLAWILKPNNHADKSGTLTQAGFQHWIDTGQIRPSDINLHIDCVTARTMIWTFKEPYARFLSLLPNALPKHYLSTFPVGATFNGKGYLADEMPDVPVSGPFKFDAVTDNGIDLSRNPDYVDALTGGPAYLAHLDFVWYGDSQSEIAGYEAATPEFNVGLDLYQSDIPSLTGVDDVLVTPVPQVEHLTLNWSPTHCFGLQAARGGACPMADPAFREALDYAIDKEAVNTATGGYGVPTDTFFLPDAWYSAPPPARSFDLVKAGQVLDAAGWVLDPARGIRFRDFNGDGIKDGKDYDAKIQACTTSGNPTRLAELNSIKDSLSQVGITVKIKTADAASVMFAGFSDVSATTPCSIYRGTYDIADFAYLFSPDDLYGDLYYSYDSNQIPTNHSPDGSNAGRVNVPAIDGVMGTLASSMDADAVFSAMKTFQKLFQNKTVEIPLYFRQDVQLVDPKLRNVSDNVANGSALWNVQHWWFAP